jgi:hypothetical protein
MATKIYGTSDDLIEVEGDVSGEHGKYGTDESEIGVLLICSDGTILEVKYGKMDLGIWEIKVHKTGDLYEKIILCEDEDAVPYSDIAIFKDGLKWIVAANEWEKIK